MRWRVFTDRVMGGVSRATASLEESGASRPSGSRGRSPWIAGAGSSRWSEVWAKGANPWMDAPLPVAERWSTTLVTWSQFEPRGLRTPVEADQLLRLGFVAGQEAFEADLAVAWVGLV